MLTQYVTTNTSFSPSFFCFNYFKLYIRNRRQSADRTKAASNAGSADNGDVKPEDATFAYVLMHILYVKLFHNNSENNKVDLEERILEIMDLWHVRTACWYIHGTAGVPRAGCLLLQRARGYIHIFWRERNFN